ncbi:MAG: FAD-dependent oxidoreductase [Oscillospiraceae bacterium]
MSKYNAGTYTGKGRGVKGEMVIDVTFDSDKITDIKITKHEEIFGHAYGLKTSPFETFVPQIIKYQSLAVPPVVGTEAVCNGIVKAVGDAAELAGGKRADLEKTPVPTPKKKADKKMKTDIIVIGSGIAGLAAAVEAKYCGADVILVEKQGVTGGSSALCGGKIIASGTKMQKAQGVLDTPEMLFDFLKGSAGNYLNDRRVMYFCQCAVKNLEWLEEQGLEVKDIEAPHASLYPWRVHNSKGGGGSTMGWGGGFTQPLTFKFEEMGGHIIYNTGIKELLTKDGACVGAICKDELDGSLVTISANSVIIATGGYSANRKVVEERYPWMKGYYYNCPDSSLGEGADAAEAIGARKYNHPYLQTMLLSMTCGCGVNEESGLIVTTAGKRFANEYMFHSMIGAELADTGSIGAYYITCGQEPFPSVQYGFSTGGTAKASTVEELAKKIDMDPAVLKATVDRYNYLCDQAFDEDYQKPASEMRALKGPEYCAIYMMPATSITFGGLEIDVAAQVLDNKGNAIPGLFAAGEVANTGNFGKGVPSCGYSIGHALHYGRVAARVATGKAML